MKKNILFISLEFWDNIWRRNQFFAIRMANDFKLFYIQPQIPFYKKIQKVPPPHPNIQLIIPKKIFPEKIRFTRTLNHWLYRLQLKLKVPKSIDILWINDHDKYYIAKQYPNAKLIYDITDDWTKFQCPIDEKKRIIAADTYLCNTAEAIIVCSHTLMQTKSNYKKKLHLIRNGVDISHYQTTKTLSLPYKKPIFMYTGSIHEERIDCDLIQKLAQKFKQISWVFIGPDFLSTKTHRKLNLPNIHFTGPIPYKDIPAYMNTADVLIVPHIISEFTMSLDPIKQYEYLVSNKPVIATAVTGFKELDQHFSIAVTHKNFVGLVQNYLNQKIAIDTEKRHKEVKNHSWDARYQSVKIILS